MSVYKRGERWHYRFQVAGRQYSGSAGRGAAKSEAVRIEAQRRAEIAAAAAQSVAERSVDDAVHRWVVEYAGRLKGRASLESKVRAVRHSENGRPATWRKRCINGHLERIAPVRGS